MGRRPRRDWPGSDVCGAQQDPPRGCGWVRVNNDVLLNALATGVVLDVVRNLYY